MPTTASPLITPPDLSAHLKGAQRAHFEALERLNAQFYERYASTFHETRGVGWFGWSELLKLLPQRPLNVIDLGCGNGRLTTLLERRWCEDRGERVTSYLGADRDVSLLSYAQEVTRRAPDKDEGALRFPRVWERFSWSGASPLSPALAHARGSADWVTLFGVMHHVYSFEARVELIAWAAQLLSSGGALSVSLWDFGDSPRYRSKLLSWDHPATRSLDPTLIEEGDALLGWRGEGDTPRFCHWVSRTEEERWLRAISERAPQLGEGELTEHPRDGNRYWTWVMT